MSSKLSMKIVFFIGILALFIYTLAKYEKNTYNKLNTTTIAQEKNLSPVGEIVKGFKLRQRININSIKTNAALEKKTCLYIMLANYSNRKNTGSFAIDLHVGEKQEMVTLNACDIKDNSYKRVCFDNILVEDLIKEPNLFIIIKGIDGKPGSSVTAWSTTDTSLGEIESETWKGRSLLFSFGALDDDQPEFRASVIFSILTFISIVLLAYPLLIKKQQI